MRKFATKIAQNDQTGQNLAFSMLKGALAWKKFTTASRGGRDRYEQWEGHSSKSSNVTATDTTLRVTPYFQTCVWISKETITLTSTVMVDDDLIAQVYIVTILLAVGGVVGPDLQIRKYDKGWDKM